MEPNHGGGRKNAATTARAVRIQIDHFTAMQSGDIAGGEKNIAPVIMTRRKFGGIRFGLSRVGRLKLGKSLFTGDTGVEEKSGLFRNHNLPHAEVSHAD